MSVISEAARPAEIAPSFAAFENSAVRHVPLAAESIDIEIMVRVQSGMASESQLLVVMLGSGPPSAHPGEIWRQMSSRYGFGQAAIIASTVSSTERIGTKSSV